MAAFSAMPEKQDGFCIWTEGNHGISTLFPHRRAGKARRDVAEQALSGNNASIKPEK